MLFPNAGAMNVVTDSNISSQAYTDDPKKLASNAKFVAHITDKFQLPTTPLIINKQALLNELETAASTYSIGMGTSAKTKALFSAFGVTQGRPEILSVVDFEPIFKKNAVDRTDAGVMFDAQLKMRSLRTEKILKFREQLQAVPAVAELVEELRLSTINNIAAISFHALTLIDINAKTEAVERALDMHSAATASTIKKIVKLFRNAMGVDFDIYTPVSLLVDVLGFNKNNVANFMSTKIVLQLLSSFRAILNNYSTKLFNSKFSETLPAYDTSTIDILAPDYQNNFQFTTTLITSAQQTFDTLLWEHYKQLQTSLPDDAFDRIKLFMHIVSRELKVSAGITRKDTFPIVNAKTGGNFAKIFDSIIGEIGSNVFTHLPNPANLAGLVKLNDPSIDGDILLFEGHEIVYQHNTFVPAKTFIDTAKTFDGTKFNTGPLQELVNKYDTTTSLAATLIEKILFLFDKSTMLNVLGADNQLMQMLGHVGAVINIFGGGISGTKVPWPEGDQLLLLKAAAFDPYIRYNLFRAFVYHATNSATLSQDSFWWHLKKTAGVQDYNKIKSILMDGLKLHVLGQSNAPLAGDIDWGTSRTWEQIEASIDNMFKSGNKTMPLTSVRSIIDSLFAAAQALSDTSILNSNGLTMFNSVNLSTIAYMIFDVFITLVDQFSIVNFSQQYGASFIDVRASTTLNAASVQYLAAVPMDGKGSTFEQSVTDKLVAQNGGKLYKGQSDLIYRKTVLQQGLNLLRDEEKMPRSFVALLRAISTNLMKTKNQVLDTLDTSNQESKKKLEFIINAPEAQTHVSLFDQTQVALIVENVARLLAILNGEFPSAFLNGVDFKQRHINALNAWLRTTKMLEKNMRVLSVGIPGGTMSGILSQQINVNGNEEFNVPELISRPIEIRVYAKNLEYPALIYKPQQFFFDVGRFVVFNELDEEFDDPQITFEHVLKNVKQRVRVGNSAVPLTEGKGFASVNYDGFASVVGKHILTSHIESEFFNHYIKLLSGLGINELDYPTNSNVITEQHSVTSLKKLILLINRYLSDIAGEQLNIDALKQTNPAVANILASLETTNTIVEKTGAPISIKLPAATSVQLINLTEGIVNFLDTFSIDSFLNDGSLLANRVLAPKLFERIFHVAVNPRDFMIDAEKTASTTAGASFLSTMSNTLLIPDESGNFKLHSDMIDIEMYELFTTISTVEAYNG